MTPSQSPETIARQMIYTGLQKVIDPEVGINIVDLGLVQDVSASAAQVTVTMTLTSPACPMGGQLLDEVEDTLKAIVPDSVSTAIDLVWEPPWNPDMMSETAKKRLGWF